MDTNVSMKLWIMEVLGGKKGVLWCKAGCPTTKPEVLAVKGLGPGSWSKIESRLPSPPTFAPPEPTPFYAGAFGWRQPNPTQYDSTLTELDAVAEWDVAIDRIGEITPDSEDLPPGVVVKCWGIYLRFTTFWHPDRAEFTREVCVYSEGDDTAQSVDPKSAVAAVLCHAQSVKTATAELAYAVLRFKSETRALGVRTSGPMLYLVCIMFCNDLTDGLAKYPAWTQNSAAHILINEAKGWLSRYLEINDL